METIIHSRRVSWMRAVTALCTALCIACACSKRESSDEGQDETSRESARAAEERAERSDNDPVDGVGEADDAEMPADVEEIYDGMYQWTDAEGRVHLSDSPPARTPQVAQASAAEGTAKLYVWRGADDTVHITSEKPAEGAELLEIVENTPTPEGTAATVVTPAAAAKPAERKPDAERASPRVADPRMWRARSAMGKLAPALAGTSAAGTTVDLQDFLGTPVWVVFSSHWCRPCRAEASVLAMLQAEYGDRVRFLTVLGVANDVETARAWALEFGLDKRSVIAGTGRTFSRGGVPFNAIVDAEGKIAMQRPGYSDLGTIRTMLDRVTAER